MISTYRACIAARWLLLSRALLEDEDLAGVPLSVDTYYAEVARDAVGAGAHMVNDISGGSLDPDMHAQVMSVCFLSFDWQGQWCCS